MKRKKIIICFISFAAAASLIFCMCFVYHRINISSVYVNAQLPPGFDDLIEEKYGESDYSVTIDNIKVDIERLDIKKYFIKYSWITGDQSGLDIVINIETVDRTDLEGYASSKIEYGGISFRPFYEELNNYPVGEKQVLEYKKQLFSRYLPFLDGSGNTMDIIITFNEITYILEDIPVNCFFE